MRRTRRIEDEEDDDILDTFGGIASSSKAVGAVRILTVLRAEGNGEKNTTYQTLC